MWLSKDRGKVNVLYLSLNHLLSNNRFRFYVLIRMFARIVNNYSHKLLSQRTDVYSLEDRHFSRIMTTPLLLIYYITRTEPWKTTLKPLFIDICDLVESCRIIIAMGNSVEGMPLVLELWKIYTFVDAFMQFSLGIFDIVGYSWLNAHW